MALFSDIDWMILLGVGAFLLVGKQNGAILRTLGRYYGRAMRLKQELLSEFTQAAEIPANSVGRTLSIRQVVLGHDGEGVPSGIPAAVTVAPRVSPPSFPDGAPYAPALSGGTWSVALAAPPMTSSGEPP